METKDLLTVRQFADKCKVTRALVYKWIEEGRLNYLTIGEHKFVNKNTPRPTKKRGGRSKKNT